MSEEIKNKDEQNEVEQLEFEMYLGGIDKESPLEIKTLIKTLNGFSQLMYATSKRYNLKKSDMKILIVGVRRNSWYNDIMIQLSTSLFEVNIADVFVLATMTWKFKSQIFQKKIVGAELINPSTVQINIEGEGSVTVDRMTLDNYNDPEIQKAIVEMSKGAVADKSITEFSLKAGGAELAFNRLDSKRTAQKTPPIYLEDHEDILVYKDNIILLIIKPDLQSNILWSFFYPELQKPIDCTIEDENFSDAIKDHAYQDGNSLTCDLTITQKWSKQYNMYIDEKYVITSVIALNLAK